MTENYRRKDENPSAVGPTRFVAKSIQWVAWAYWYLWALNIWAQYDQPQIGQSLDKEIFVANLWVDFLYLFLFLFQRRRSFLFGIGLVLASLWSLSWGFFLQVTFQSLDLIAKFWKLPLHFWVLCKCTWVVILLHSRFDLMFSTFCLI